jgi:hypothetical protein
MRIEAGKHSIEGILNQHLVIGLFHVALANAQMPHDICGEYEASKNREPALGREPLC